ncbi:MAG TPA: CxxxxCH/CxxCH domain-containing protein [Myxococcales bacterium]|jgi:predicted CxxxxCH...CXXCH cytochrome family protein
MRSAILLLSRRLPLTLLAALLPAVLSGCEQKPLADGMPDEVRCDACHGDPATGLAAPPRAIDPKKTTLDPEVGAHRLHVVDGLVRKGLACAECHPMPATLEAPGHIDLATPEHPADPADVTWGTLATTQGQTPSWDRSAATCSSVYCHGVTLAGGTRTRPRWTYAEPPAWTREQTSETCRGCHGNPPPPPHPASGRCSNCHQRTVRPDGTIDLEGGLHVDGIVEVGGTCNACHGSDLNPAPPTDLAGRSDTAERGVGAHQQHLSDSAIRKAVACEECHRVPADVGDPGHMDTDLPAELTWGPLATSGGQAPAWDGATCSAVYCHGSTLSGGRATAPKWTQVDGSQAVCDSCHGNPPPAPHPQRSQCRVCHPGTLKSDGTIDVEGGQHIDGTVQVGTACNSCHGNQANAAPPQDTLGATDTTARGVGAHQAHLVAGRVRSAVACSECHLVPATVGEAGHIDSDHATLTWGPLATSGGLAPAWDGANATCSSVYCHGASLTGGAHVAPRWTQVDGSQIACDGCHGNPPPAPHPASGACGNCHPGTLKADGTIDLAGGQHVDGALQVASACNACHGDSAGDPARPADQAPPTDTSGRSATSERGVGAHQAHLADSAIRKAVSCAECHLVPATADAAGHLDSALPAELTWGPLATAQAQAPQWDGTRCASVYCHGSSLAGGAHVEPVWTQVDGSQVACDGCHGNPPPAPHPQSASCRTCHSGTVAASGGIDVAGGLHIDGVVQAASACNACHGNAAGDPANPADQAPPRDTSGNSTSASRGVGAHQTHLAASAVHVAFACDDCHLVPATVGAAGHTDSALPAELTWGALARSGGASPAWNGSQCSSVYCHGATLSGGTLTDPNWTVVDGSQAACGTCHGNPPPAHYGSNCSACHPTVDASGNVIDKVRHVDGHVDVTGGPCGSCHALPPATGAHVAHFGDAATKPAYEDTRVLADYFPSGKPYYMFGCGNCHPLDPSKHLDGVTEVELYSASAPAGTLKARALPTASYDASAKTCSGTYCHSSGQATPVSRTSPGWTSGAKLGCDGCHDDPPRYPSGGAGSETANTHLQMGDDGWEFGHYGGLPGAWHQVPNKHGGDPSFNASPITCQACHFDTTDPSATGPSGFYWLDTTQDAVLPGGDASRLSQVLPGQCSTCHQAGGTAPAGTGKVLPLKHVDGQRQVSFDQRTLPSGFSYPGAPGGADAPSLPYWTTWTTGPASVDSAQNGSTWSVNMANASYDPATRTCSSVACHLNETSVQWGVAPVGNATCNNCHQY